jgi:glycosyltransferase involved in cell wall biosynthesis/GT2 family glycosyltransferase
MIKQFIPKVSIVIPVYNGSNYIEKAIDSALNQTYENIEIIVVNDGSNDDYRTEKICKSYGNKIKYFSKENGGVASALNIGIEKMTGEYFSWLSHDDMYYPEKIQSQVDTLNKLNDKKTIIYSGLDIIDENDNHIEYQDYASKYKKEDLNKPLFAFFHLALNGCAMLIHKSHFDKVGLFNEDLPTTQDYDLWFRILRGSNILYNKDILVKSRSHSEQGSKALIGIHVEECNRFWLKVFSSLTEKEIIETAGSKDKFYLDLYHSFNNLTQYDKVIAFLFGKVIDIYSEDILLEKVEEKRQNLAKDLSKEICIDQEDLPKRISKLLSYHKKKKTRIVFFTAFWYDRGGLNRVIARVASLLSSYYEVFVICLEASGNEKGYKLDPNVKYLEFKNSEFSKIPVLLKLLKADIFVGSNNCYKPLICMYKDMENLGIKVIMWNHEHYFVPYFEDNLNESVLERGKVFKEVTAVLWLTKFSARIGKLFADRVCVMKNPLSFSLDGKYKKKDRNLNIISVARFDSERKRLDRLIMVFSEVLKILPDAKLFVVGSYDLDMYVQGQRKEKISELIHRLRIPKNNIIFTGEIKNIEKYYAEVTVNVMTSEREGFGLTVIESALFGIPSVVFGGGGMGDIISDNINGFVVNDGDIKEMAKKIILLLQDGVLYKKMSKSVLRMANDYSENIVQGNWIKLIEGVTSLPKEKLGQFLKKNFSAGEDIVSKQDFNDVVRMYEVAIQEKINENFVNRENLKELENQKKRLRKIENSILWRVTWPLRKFVHLLELFRIQGFNTTIKNIFLKFR